MTGTQLGLIFLMTSTMQAVSAAPKDVVVMIHGAGGGGWEYDRWRPVFERAGWQVIAPDLMPAKTGLANTTFEDYVRQVRSWVPREHGSLVLIGASMGGVLALKAAELIKPDTIILVNSAPPTGVGKPHEGKPYPPVVRWANGPIKDTRDALPDGDEATVQWANPRWRDESGTALNTLRRGVSVQRPGVSVLVVLGRADRDIPLDTGLALAQWAHADVQLYAGTSHIGPLYGRRATEIAEAAERWLKSRFRHSQAHANGGEE